MGGVGSWGQIVECVLWVSVTGCCGELLLALVALTGCAVLPACMVWDDTVEIESTIKVRNNGTTWCAKLICTNFAKLLPMYESI